MGQKTFRVASKLEIRHYRELLQPIHDFLGDHDSAHNAAPGELIDITQSVFFELARFGYVPTQDALLVDVDLAEAALDAPELDSMQAAAVRAITAALFARLRR